MQKIQTVESAIKLLSTRINYANEGIKRMENEINKLSNLKSISLQYLEHLFCNFNGLDSNIEGFEFDTKYEHYTKALGGDGRSAPSHLNKDGIRIYIKTDYFLSTDHVEIIKFWMKYKVKFDELVFIDRIEVF